MCEGEWGIGLHTFSACRWYGGRVNTPPPTHTHSYSCACISLGNKAKQRNLGRLRLSSLFILKVDSKETSYSLLSGSRKIFERGPFTLKVLPPSYWSVIAPCGVASTMMYGPSHLLRSFPCPNNLTLELKSNTLSPSLNSFCLILLSCHLLVLSLWILALWYALSLHSFSFDSYCFLCILACLKFMLNFRIAQYPMF
jgi:hypothetical protein